MLQQRQKVPPGCQRLNLYAEVAGAMGITKPEPLGIAGDQPGPEAGALKHVQDAEQLPSIHNGNGLQLRQRFGLQVGQIGGQVRRDAGRAPFPKHPGPSHRRKRRLDRGAEGMYPAQVADIARQAIDGSNHGFKRCVRPRGLTPQDMATGGKRHRS